MSVSSLRMSSPSLGTQVGGRLGCANSRGLELVEDCELIYLLGLLGVFFCSIKLYVLGIGHDVQMPWAIRVRSGLDDF